MKIGILGLGLLLVSATSYAEIVLDLRKGSAVELYNLLSGQAPEGIDGKFGLLKCWHATRSSTDWNWCQFGDIRIGEEYADDPIARMVFYNLRVKHYMQEVYIKEAYGTFRCEMTTFNSGDREFRCTFEKSK